jgi:hypothetical protein
VRFSGNEKAVEKSRDTPFKAREGTVGDSCVDNGRYGPDRDDIGDEVKVLVATQLSTEELTR